MAHGLNFLVRGFESGPQSQFLSRRLTSAGTMQRSLVPLLLGAVLFASAGGPASFGAGAGRPVQGEKWTIADLNLALVAIPAGSFVMGSPANERGRDASEGPQTHVTIAKPFWLGATEVTQPQWEALMGNNPSQFKTEGHPAERFSWVEAAEFCAKLTERERSAGRLPAGYVYALPTEAQWEYACRAGTTGNYAGKLDDLAWYFKNTEGLTTKPVGQKQPNAWGLYDMHGNLWEWCADWYGPYPGGNVNDPNGPPSGTIRVVRGGGWGDNALDCRAAFRRAFKPDRKGNSVGLRVALVPMP